ncbi:ribonuclease E/G [Pseudoruegeria sp. SHC-113]|uniref:ribonuclease E/G n=1 Tax=Pseudoruegeria sp. SHC-113 TaxID=2855439 RepID=UPI0021BB797B|nr:ribonuclease E/G [Pseudoruegeria sp. SHC-113]MCT8161689.1 ribonuclease E/G [Pseudoruegeria sp. SHC-113]
MKGTVIILDHLRGREVAARLVDGRLEDFLFTPADPDVPLPGAIYRAIVERPMKGQGGVMVRLPEGTGFLRQAKGLAAGQAILVQVTGFAEGGKAVPVTQRVLFKSRYAIVTPDAPGLNISRAIREEERRAELKALADDGMEGSLHGLILRTAASTGPDDDIAEDIAAMRAAADAILIDAEGDTPELLLDGPAPHMLAWRDWPEPDHVESEPGGLDRFDALSAIEALASPHVTLPGGASMYIEPTRALVAVDVNTGGDTSPAAGLKANIEAIRALPRQLRCRGLGGQIVLDLAPFPKKDRRPIEQQLRAVFRADGIETVLVGFTGMGLFELQRKRERLPLDRGLLQ